jgi:hypothetical protein
MNQDELLDALAEVTEQRKLLEEQEKNLRAALGSFFESRGASRFTHGNFIFEMRQNAGRKTLDKTALEAAGIDLEPYYKVGRPFMTLSIKRLT